MATINARKSKRKEGRKLNSVADYFIEHELFQMFAVDRTLWFYGLVTIGVFIYKILTENFAMKHFFYGLMLLVGFTVTISVQFARVRRSQKLISINKMQVLMFLLNALIVTLSSIRFLKIFPGEWNTLTDQWLVAGWEQLIFGVVGPFLLLLITSFARKQRMMEIGLFLVIIGVCSIVFSIAHLQVYGPEVGTLMYLFIIGYGLMGITYSISPSLAWSLHLMNNLLMLARAGVI